MTLTGELRDRSGPLSRFLREYFGEIRAIAAAFRRATENVSTTRPTAPLGRHYATIGTAFDWRLRYYLSTEPGPGLRPSAAMDPRWSAFLASLDEVVRRVRPVGRRLGRLAEDVLNRYCIVLALTEQLGRAGPEAVGQSPLFAPEPKQTVAELLATARDEWIKDLRALSWAAYDTLGEQLSQPSVLNPTFAGSPDVGGADADLILGDCLVEIKTTLNPRWNRDWLYQLLGYVLLDYGDAYKIRSIGIYLARQKALVRWPLDEVIATSSGDRSLHLEELRARLREVLRREQRRGQDLDEAAAPRLGSVAPTANKRTRADGAKPQPGEAAIQLELPYFR